MNIYVAEDIDVKARRIGKTVHLNGKMRGIGLGSDWRSLTTLPVGMRPDIPVYFTGAPTLENNVVQMDVETDGVLYAKTLGGTVDGITFSASWPVA